MANKKNNITFSDIAKYTNFSKTTISRYFNHPETLTEQNRNIIAEALEKLNYKENKVAKILANGCTEFIGIIIPNLYVRYYSEILNQILSTYEAFGYKFLVFISNGSKEDERTYLQELLAYKIEGLIILSHTLSSIELANLHLPLVAVEREDAYISSVNSDNYQGTILACENLSSHDCEVFLHISAPTTRTTPAYKRVEAFDDYCEKHQLLHHTFMEEMGTSHEEVKSHLTHILEQIELNYSGIRKGIFISGDTYANVFLNLLIRKYGYLPNDYFLIAFDDSPISREAIIPISSVGQQIDKIAFEAVELLISQIQAQKERPAFCEPVHKIISPVLIPRETTEKN